MTETEWTMTKSRRKIEAWIAYGVYAGAVAVALLAVAEIAVRILGPDRNADPYGGRAGMEAYSYFDWRQQYFEDLAGFDRGLDYEPHSLWKNRDYASATINVEGGYRHTWTPESDPSARDEAVFIFGGSTLFGIEGPDDHTIASYLAKRWSSDATPGGVRYVVHNYGVSGFTSDNSLHLLVDLLSDGHRPRRVIFYDGVNETHYKVALGIPHFRYDHFRRLGTETVRGLAGRLAGHSALLRTWLRRSGGELEYRRDAPALEAATASMLEDYFRNVDLVRALGETYGFTASFFWQGTIYTTGKQLTAEEQGVYTDNEPYAPAFEAVERQLSEGVLGAQGVHDLRSSWDDVRESTFLDLCHVTPIGNAAVAAAILRAIEDGGAIEDDDSPTDALTGA